MHYIVLSNDYPLNYHLSQHKLFFVVKGIQEGFRLLIKLCDNFFFNKLDKYHNVK